MDSSCYRFYVPGLREQVEKGGKVVMAEGEAHHARGVLRLKGGEEVEVFDGVGGWCRGRMEVVGKHGARVVVEGGVAVEEREGVRLVLATAVPKGERAEWLVEQASQLGVAAVQWVAWERGVVVPREGGGKMEKWKRLAVESAKQCGRNYLMEIFAPVGIESLNHRVIGSLGGIESSGHRIIGSLGEGEAHRVLWLDPGEGGASVGEAVGDWRGPVLALIGPEGGFSEGERKILEDAVASGWARRVRLGRTVLRIETAGVAVAALVNGGIQI